MRRLVILFLASLMLAAPPIRAVDYRIDTGRSHADFNVRLLWVRSVKGRFTQIAGEVALRPDGTATVDARIGVDSVTMPASWMRRWVLAEEFFDAAHYPTIHFVSEPVPIVALARGGVLDGELTLRGITRPVHFELQPTNCLQIVVQGCNILVRGHVSRAAFGMNDHRAALSDTVRLSLTVALAPALR